MEHILGASNLFTPLWCRCRCNGKKWLQILALSSLETWWDTSLSYILWEKSVSNVYIHTPLGHSIVQKSFSEGVKTDFIKDIFRCFYCYPFKQQEFVCKNAKILLLLKGVPEMDLDYFLFPLHGHMDRLVLVYRSRIECFPMVASFLPLHNS